MSLAPIDLDAIRMEAARRHNTLLSPDDPILITVTLNELVLGSFLARAEEAAARLEQRGAGLMAQEVKTVKETAERMIAGAAEYIAQEVRKAAEEAEKRSSSAVEDRLRRAESAARQTEAVRTPIMIAAVVAVASTLLGLGVAIGAALN